MPLTISSLQSRRDHTAEGRKVSLKRTFPWKREVKDGATEFQVTSLTQLSLEN